MSKLTKKKLVLFLASMGETGLTHDIFFNSHLGLSRSLRPKEAGRLVKEADFEAENFFLLKQII